MKKIFKGLICAGLCSTFALTGVFGCNKSEHRDPESAPLKLAIGAKDGNFNPLFYTAANDGTIANMTQASLLTADAEGKLAYGENYPTVTLDYRETYYDKGGIETGTGDGRKIEGYGDNNGSTAYEFVIKNGVKFSDGVDLTVMDVLFNLYVYLDPLYSGSATIYSTKIKGLAAYTSQDPNAGDDTTQGDLTKYYAAAQQRISNLINWSNGETSSTPQIQKDLKTVKELYKKELESDWNNVTTNWKLDYKNYFFTEAWQAFFFMEGMAFVQKYTNLEDPEHPIRNADRYYDENNNGKRDDDEKYLTDFDPEFEVSDPLNINPADHDKGMNSTGVSLTALMDGVATPEKIAEFKATHEGYSDEDAKLALEGEAAIKQVYDSRTEDAGIFYILTYCATASTAFDAFVKEERANDVPVGGMQVKSISGITVSKSKDFHGKDLGEEHDILKIMISGVDPKAKWNFSLAIAPMHYYSSPELTAAAMADYNDGKLYNNTATNFGVEWKSSHFMDEVLAAPAKTNLPVGAGAYKCCSYKMDGSTPTGATFNYNKICYYERNEYFTTFGSGVDNAKIKYVSYKEMSDDQIVNALKTGEIDYGTPIAKATNQTEVNNAGLKSTTYLTGGYGYIGINPKSQSLRSVYVRQAIMYAFNTSPIVEYYGNNLVSLINRPMSVTSWASPENPDNLGASGKSPTRYYEMTGDEFESLDLERDMSDVDFIRYWVGQSGTYYYDEESGQITDGSNQLKVTFTIAGETSDHPSYSMFIEAKAFLEKCGFKINVETSALALQKLTKGDLEVWAAAWSSSIDPDPYQIYSIYSNASSTKNWYKEGIMSDQTGDFKYEKAIANELADKIEAGRETLIEADRRRIYGQSQTTEKLYKFYRENPDTESAEFKAFLKKLCTLDLVMEMAVEFPTYQRYELCVYNSAVLDESTMRLGKAASHNMGPIDELYKVGYLK